METCYVFLLLCEHSNTWPQLASIVLTLGGVLSLHQTPERLHE